MKTELYTAVLEMAKADKEVLKSQLRHHRLAQYQTERKLAAITAAIEAFQVLANELETKVRATTGVINP